jgi:hypothetical protein
MVNHIVIDAVQVSFWNEGLLLAVVKTSSVAYILKHVGFSLYICQYNFFSFQFDPQTLFLDDQILFKEQLILNSY